MSTRRADVIVIGAGLSGLCAARRLQAAGRSVIVVEARDRVGGRSLTQTLEGHPVDLGGQWLGPTQDRALALAKALGLRTYAQHDEGRKVMELCGVRSTYRGLLPWIGVRGLGELAIRVAQLELFARKVPLDAPATMTDAAALDRQTVRTWLDATVTGGRARSVLEIATQMVFAGEPEQLSLLYFLFYLRSGGGFIRLTSTRGGAQAWRIHGGAQPLSLGLAERLQQPVVLGCPVSAVRHEGDDVVVLAGERRFEARHAIVAVPPALAAGIELGSARTEARRRAEVGMPMGSVIKCNVAYRRPFWREAGLSGEAISDGTPIRATFDGCAPDLSYCGLVVFVIADQARTHGELPPQERKRRVIEHLVRLFGPEAADPLGYVDHDWSREPHSGGCYVGLMKPGVLSEVGNALREPAGRIHFAGTETAMHWCGYFDGAIEAGERAADEVVERLRSHVPGTLA
ncbi:flavin monoamine oxidase family protein [Paraliomyxa miuraensis]|uniref:flavin monoamine oxidase family protein n=1 Tax=Paraliomyxa miuraensis TaxID=376150 RepID=UPI0022595A5E|nr:FAD-dependent oxidoreductase [Paraliomyxa miuraensis]MCX4243935.1 FAD-dependent oxidoreductase [Paraliomyxa miuraensis]